jgi:hypothetical protein
MRAKRGNGLGHGANTRETLIKSCTLRCVRGGWMRAALRRQQGAFVSIDSDLEICRIAAKKR